MPCNTLHIFIEDIRKTVNIPVLSIIEETNEIIKGRRIKKVGLLATSKTISKNLFGSKFKSRGIEQIIPIKEDQSDLDKIIHRLVLSKHTRDDEVKANLIIRKMREQGVKNIILACTDLQLIIKKHPQVKILDTMQILAKVSSNEILKNDK